VFPADNPWNTDVSQDEVDPNSANYLASMHAATEFLHPDFGHNPHYGIPVTLAPAPTPFVPMKFFLYPQESDKGPYPYPPNARIEGGSNSHGDRHVLVVHEGSCHLYETYDSYYVGPGWRAGNGATWDLSSNALRHICWTSADAAGLSVFAGLLKISEVKAGVVTHAIRVTFNTTQQGYVYPATHSAGSSALGSSDPPMGLRLRLKASFDASGLTAPGKVVAKAMQTYGLIVADIGSDWYFQGDSDDGWDDQDKTDTYIGELLTDFGQVSGADFDVLDTGDPIATGN